MTYLREKLHRSAVFARILALALTVSFCQMAQAVPPLWEASYNILATELNGTAGGDISTLPPSGSFGGAENIALGFNFPFGGKNYSHIVVDSDGAIVLKNSKSGADNVLPMIWRKDIFQAGFSNYGAGSVKPVLLPFGTYMNQRNTGGKTYFRTFNGAFNGFSGNRAVITWENSSMPGDATADISFQAQLFGDGRIIFSYRVISSTSNWNTRVPQGIVVGISNGDGVTPLGSSDFSSGDTGIDLTGYEIWCRNDDPSEPEYCAQAGLGKNNAFDLHDRSIVFNPDGADGFLVSQSIEKGSGKGGSGICAVSSQDSPAGALIWDDSYNILATELNGTAGGDIATLPPSGSFGGSENIALGFNFPFGGKNYSHIVVDSDGAIVLKNSGSGADNVPPMIWRKDIFQAAFSNYGAGSVKPVLLPFGTYMNQRNTGGKTFFKFARDTFAGFSGNRAVITWEKSSTPGDATTDISFQAHLLGNGTIIFSYKVKSNVDRWDTRAPHGIVVGISSGDGAFPAGSQNLSTYDFGIDLTGYEVWCRNDDPVSPEYCVQSGLGNNDAFDLDDRSVVFNRDGTTGFLVSSSIKNGSGNGGNGVCAKPPAPRAPVAVNDSITAIEDVTFKSIVDLDANDTDANGDRLTVVSGNFTTRRGGKIKINSDGSYTYTPAKNFNGSDSYNYTVKDNALSDIGTLNINVRSVNDAPVARDDSAAAKPNTVFRSTRDLDSNDTDVDGGGLTVLSGPFATAKGGRITIATNGSYTYTPPANFVGMDSVGYTVTDGKLKDTADLHISVTTVGVEATSSVLKSLNQLRKKKVVKKHRRSKLSIKKAIKHLESALVFLMNNGEINGKAEIEAAIADLGNVKKKKSVVETLINELASIP